MPRRVCLRHARTPGLGALNMTRRLSLIVALLIAVSGCEASGGQGSIATGSGAYGSSTLVLEPLAVITDTDSMGAWAPEGFSGAKLLDDGRIVVPADGSLHVFDSSGIREKVHGRRGKGPGEFSSILGFALCGDGRWIVTDWVERRLTVLRDTGPAVETVPYPPSRVSPSLSVLGCSDQPVFANHTIDASGSKAFADGIRRDTLVVIAGGPSLQSFDTLAKVASGISARGLRMPFGSYALAASNAGSIAYGFTGDSVIFVSAGADAKVAEVAVAGLPRGEVTPELQSQYYQNAEETTPKSIWERELKGIYDGLTWPERLPLWDGLLLGDRGDVWVREYRQPLAIDTLDQVWHIVAASGEAGDILVLGPRDQLLSVQDDRALVSRANADGVERLELARISGSANP